MLIRRPNQPWHAPASESFDDEAALELLLNDSPDLLPGSSGAPVAVVSQLYVPDTGPVDLAAVSTNGAITLVECKLRANPEIRRSVLGQVFAYASGLWRVSYDEFDAAYAKRAKVSLVEHVRRAAHAHSVEFSLMRPPSGRRLSGRSPKGTLVSSSRWTRSPRSSAESSSL